MLQSERTAQKGLTDASLDVRTVTPRTLGLVDPRGLLVPLSFRTSHTEARPAGLALELICSFAIAVATRYHRYLLFSSSPPQSGLNHLNIHGNKSQA